jgi:hypothetical protein
LKYWASRIFFRLGKPMPLAAYYLIMFALSIIAAILAAIVFAIVEAFR